jgi:hypothetical protein
LPAEILKQEKQMPEQLKRYYIVKEHPMRIISKCKVHSRGTLASFLLGFCVLYAVANWVPQVLALYFPATNIDLLSQYSNVDPAELSKLPATPLVVFFYLMLFNGVFRLSECLYALTYIRNRVVDYRALGESLSYYLKAFGLFLVQTLVVSFWTMFFIVPGVLAALNFAQTFYIFADDPDKSITDILIGKPRNRLNLNITIRRIVLRISNKLIETFHDLTIRNKEATVIITNTTKHRERHREKTNKRGTINPHGIIWLNLTSNNWHNLKKVSRSKMIMMKEKS